MKYCPECGERFDEDIIKFCTKDGTPLVEEEQPNFTAMPSQETGDDIGEETVIRRRPIEGATSPETTPERERFVISTGEPEAQRVRARPAQAYYPPPPEQNTGKVIVLTILGTVFVLACGAGLFWLLQRNEPANANNINTNMPNLNLNLNTNAGFDSNFNFNSFNLNANFNLPNLNVNLPRPTPTPRPSPSPRPSPVASPMPFPSPRPTTTPRTGPRPPTLANRPGGQGN